MVPLTLRVVFKIRLRFKSTPIIARVEHASTKEQLYAVVDLTLPAVIARVEDIVTNK